MSVAKAAKLTLRIFSDELPYSVFEVLQTTDATVGHLATSLATAMGREEHTVLMDDVLGAAFRPGSLLATHQIVLGQPIRLIDQAVDPYVPELLQDDVLRLVHESGPQLGFAWPLGPDCLMHRWRLDREACVIQLAAPEDDADIELSFDSLAAVVEVKVLTSDWALQVNGRSEAEAAIVAPGSLLQIEPADSIGSPGAIELRLLSRGEHEQIRLRNGAAAHRVPASDWAKMELAEPETYKWHAPQPPEMPKWDWADIALQEGSMLVMYLFLMLRTGFAWYIAPFILLPLLRGRHRYRQHQKECAARVTKYDTEIAAMDRELGVLANRVMTEASIIALRNQPLPELTEAARRRGAMLWQRRPERESFLKVTLGQGLYVSPSTGEIDGAATDEHIDVWRKDVNSVRELNDAPIEVDLSTGNLAIIGPAVELHLYLADLILRLCLMHSPAHLAVAALLPTDPVERSQLRWMRWLPHTSAITDLFAGERFPAGPVAVREAVKRNADLAAEATGGSSHILLLVHEASGVDAGELTRYQAAAPGRVHILWIGSTTSRIPADFGRWLQLTMSEDLDLRYTTGRLLPDDTELRCNLCSSAEIADEAAAQMAGLVDESAGAISQAIAPVVGLGSIVQVPSQSGPWRSPESSLVATLGEDGSGAFELDLVKHGPHVLVAGTTGSGKSELLRSLVFSLATSYGPQDLALLLIDFKGGASLGDLGALPHAIGSVTNLEAIDVDRVVRFLQAEIERRQKWLAPYNGEYRRYFRDAATDPRLMPLPRLVVVIDEFAGFIGDGKGKREEAVLNLAARGRSLGVHLVIATQSPRGVVTGQVRANVNARIALKVLDSTESEQVIDSKEAASIPLALPGRAFARLESGQLHQFQSAWTEARQLGVQTREAIELADFDPVVDAAPSIGRGAGASDEPTDAVFLLKALAGLAKASSDSQPVLMPSLIGREPRDPAAVRDRSSQTEAVLDVDSRVLLGRRDEPERQQQSQGYVDLAQGGLLLMGGSASGRSHALAAVALDFVAANPNCQLVLIDCGGEDLLKAVPRSSFAVNGPDKAAIFHLLAQLEQDYGERTAPVLVVVDRLDIVQDLLQDVSGLARQIANGARRSIYTVASADSRLPLEPELRRAFRHRQDFVEEHVGLVQGMGAGAALTQVADPGRPDPRRLDNLLPRPLGEVQERFPADRLYQTPGHWRPLGFPDVTAIALPTAAGPGFALAIDEVRHEAVSLNLGDGIAITGTNDSGKTTTLLTICRHIFDRTRKRIPIIASRAVPVETDWLFDLSAWWGAGERLVETGRDYANVWQERDDLARVLVIDDLNHLDNHLRVSIPEPGRRDELIIALKESINLGELRIVASAPIEYFLGLASPRLGAEQLSYRGQLINLQPLPTHLMRSWSGITSEALALVANMSAREYLPGQAALVNNGRRRDVTIIPHPAALDLATWYLQQEKADII